MPAGNGGYDDCVANVGEAWLMPGAQDRWGQLTEPSAPNREATAADRPQFVDRPERGSLAEMQQRLERLPPGHPSSPYNDDLTRKPPVVRLKDLELPLQGSEHSPNGAATHYEPDPAEEVPATVTAEPASSNGTSGRTPAAGGPSVANWASTREWASATAGGGTADGLDDLTDGRDHTADEPDTHEPDTHEPDNHQPDTHGWDTREPDTHEADTREPDTHEPDTHGWDTHGWDTHGWDTHEPDTREPDTRGWDTHEPDSDELARTANGRDGTANGRGTHDWLSSPAWGTSDLGGGNSEASGAAGWNGTADWDSPADWDSAPDPDRNGAYQDDEGGPGWTEPESAADTLSHAVFDGGPHREAAAPVTGADGSWQWKGRYLTPDECHVAEEALGRCRIAEGRNVFGGYGHSGLTPAMRRVEAQLGHGSLAPDTENFTLKSADSFKKKLADLILRHPDKSAEELSLEVPDGIRYGFIVEAEHYTEATLQAHSRLKGNGFDLEVRRNCWKSPGYKGINSRWRDPAHDLVFEVQFHTGESWDAWQRAHALYEAIRDLSTPPEQRARLRAIYTDMSAAIPMPPGCTAIPDYRKEGR
jgi:hypothetical protein